MNKTPMPNTATPENTDAKGDTDAQFVKTYMTATVTQEKKTGPYVSYCPALDLRSRGDTLHEAKENTVEAAKRLIESCFEQGTLNETLVDCGFRLVTDQSRQQRAEQKATADKPDTETTVFRFSVQIPVAAYQ